MKELYDIFKDDIDRDVLEKSKSKCIKEGRREGRRDGKKEGVINTLLMLVKDGIISVEDAAKRANISVSNVSKIFK